MDFIVIELINLYLNSKVYSIEVLTINFDFELG